MVLPIKVQVQNFAKALHVAILLWRQRELCFAAVKYFCLRQQWNPFAFSIVPLRAAALLGAAAIGLSVLYALYAVYVRFWLHAPQGFTALIVATTFLSGVNLFFLGIIGEYVGRLYEEAKARPHYVVRKGD